MKMEKVIVGLVMVIVGFFMLYMGYQKLQPDEVEKTLSIINDFSKNLTGQEIPKVYKKDNTEAIIFLISGLVLSIFGIRTIYYSRKQNHAHNKVLQQ